MLPARPRRSRFPRAKMIVIVTLAIVPARGGSKGLPRKNLALVGGRSLVGRAVDVALRASGVDEVLVSSDDEAVLAEATAAGARAVLRPARLAEDGSTTLEVVLHHLAEEDDVDRVVVLQPTSPLRHPNDVDRCLSAVAAGALTAATVSAAHPAEWLFRQLPDSSLEPVLGWPLPVRRQEAAAVVALNGAVYAADAVHLRRGGSLVEPGTIGVVMPPERSIDIDSELDLELARLLNGDGRL